MKRFFVNAIVIINSLLILSGLFVIHYGQARGGAAHWTPPAPPEHVDPYRHLRAHFQPAA
jgi:hypothetical protein